MSKAEASLLFQRLDQELSDVVDQPYFQDPRDFQSLSEVLEVLGERAHQMDEEIHRNLNSDSQMNLLEILQSQNPRYSRLIQQRDSIERIIEDVVKFQHGGLNNSVDTMAAVLREYSHGQEDISELRSALKDTKEVLTSKKSGQLAMKDLWYRKQELEDTLQILQDIEWLNDSPEKIQKFIIQKKYLNAIKRLNKSVDLMFSEDLIEVSGLGVIREQLLELKGKILEDIVIELREDVTGMHTLLEFDDDSSDDEEIGEMKSLDLTFGINIPLSEDLAIDESFELNFSRSSSIAHETTYTRLLIRAVRELRCEDDVERLLLESVIENFQLLIKRLRRSSFTRLRRKVSQSNSLSLSDQLDDLVSSLFAQYVWELLQALLMMTKKLLYVLRLLSISKMSESVNTESKNPNLLEYSETSSGLPKDKISSNLSIPVVTNIVSSIQNINSSVNSSIQNISSFVNSSTNTVNSAIQSINTSINSSIQSINNKLPILHQFHKESSSQQNLLIKKNCIVSESSKATILSLIQEIEYLIINELKLHLKDTDIEKISDQKEDASVAGIEAIIGEDQRDQDSTESIFPPSMQLITPIYASVNAYATQLKKILQEEGFFETQFKKTQLSVVEEFEVINNSAIHSFSSNIYNYTQDLLETELMPVVQGAINQTMREIQMHTQQYFSTRITGVSIFSSPQAQPCIAAGMCLKAAKPLFGYWLQFPLHSNMVITILDRLIRGFISSIKEEVETMTWKALASNEVYKKKSSAMLRSCGDPLFVAYREEMYLKQSKTLEGLLEMCNPSLIGLSDVDASTIVEPMDANTWNDWKDVWDLRNVSYIITIDKLMKDFSDVSCLATIAFSCDWLVQSLIRLYQNSMKQRSLNSKDMKDDDAQSFFMTFQAFVRDLSKLADDLWAILRLECEMTSFYYLHQISFMKLLHNDVQEDHSTDVTTINQLFQHLLRLEEAISSGSTSDASIMILSSIVRLIPMILMRCIQLFFQNAWSVYLAENSQSRIHHSTDSLKQDAKTRLLKIIVIAQQSLHSVFNTTNNLVSQSFHDRFENLRQYIILIDMTPSELKQFVMTNAQLFSKQEYASLWTFVSAAWKHQGNKLEGYSFEEVWKSIPILVDN